MSCRLVVILTATRVTVAERDVPAFKLIARGPILKSGAAWRVLRSLELDTVRQKVKAAVFATVTRFPSHFPAHSVRLQRIYFLGHLRLGAKVLAVNVSRGSP